MGIILDSSLIVVLAGSGGRVQQVYYKIQLIKGIVARDLGAFKELVLGVVNLYMFLYKNISR